MNEPRPPANAETDRRLQVRRRAKRGLIAGYIHQLSERHNGGDPRRPGRPEGSVEAARGG